MLSISFASSSINPSRTNFAAEPAAEPPANAPASPPKTVPTPGRIALPNALRLAQVYNGDLYNKEWCLQSNQIDYLTLYKKESCTRIELPLLVTLDGNYKFENIVLYNDRIYHISNSLNLNISK